MTNIWIFEDLLGSYKDHEFCAWNEIQVEDEQGTLHYYGQCVSYCGRDGDVFLYPEEEEVLDL